MCLRICEEKSEKSLVNPEARCLGFRPTHLHRSSHGGEARDGDTVQPRRNVGHDGLPAESSGEEPAEYLESLFLFGLLLVQHLEDGNHWQCVPVDHLRGVDEQRSKKTHETYPDETDGKETEDGHGGRDGAAVKELDGGEDVWTSITVETGRCDDGGDDVFFDPDWSRVDESEHRLKTVKRDR